jgi:hypothetical protein
MIQLASALFSYVLAFLRSRHDLGLEILALHQQLASSTRIINAALRPAGSHLECRNSRPASSRFTVGNSEGRSPAFRRPECSRLRFVPAASAAKDRRKSRQFPLHGWCAWFAGCSFELRAADAVCLRRRDSR